MPHTIVLMFCLAGSADDARLGKLSEKYESGGRGPGTVSTGVGDRGGVSYGTYQLASKLGRADQFVKKHYPDRFTGLKGGTPEFTRRWKELAAEDPKALRAKEHAFIKETHYDPQVRKLRKELGLDVNKRSFVFRDVVWSTAVHHGPNTDVITMAAKSLTAGGKKLDEVSDADLIRAIYAERGRKSPDGKLARFRGVGDALIPGLTRRFTNEMKDALEALRREIAPVMPRAEDAVGLNFSFDRGPPSFAESTADTIQVLEIKGQEIKQRQMQTLYLRWTPQGFDADGHGLLAVKIIGIKMSLDVAGTVLAYDSVTGKTTAGPMTDLYRGLHNAELRLIFDTKTMNVVRSRASRISTSGSSAAHAPKTNPLRTVGSEQIWSPPWRHSIGCPSIQ